MLRIDDTDKQRSKKEYEDVIRDNLKWLGLVWSEEARQSARFERYNEVTARLKAEGRIYACYETPEELEFKRKRALSKGLPPIYDRQALRNTAEDIAKYEAEGRKPHYRFKLLPGEIKWNDMVRGEVCYEAEKLSDPIVIREDGSFLYHLPSVIDDVDFGITHIVRGEDHVTNTASQIQMFEALGGRVPTFAHLPLLTGKEGKLSKRLGSLGVSELRAEGIEPMAVSSFLAKLGTSEAIEPFYDLETLAATLDFAKIGRAQPKFDEEELKHFIDENKKFFQNVDYETSQAMKAFLNMKQIPSETEQKEEMVDMCKAIQEMYDDGVKDGIQQGIAATIRTCQNLNASRIETFNNVRKEYKLTEEQTEEYLNTYWK